MKKIIPILFLALSTVATAREFDETSAREAAATLTKSGSYATCSLDDNEVEAAVKLISKYYSNKFISAVTGSKYSGGKACLVLNISSR